MKSVMDQIREAISRSAKTRYRIAQETGVSESQLCRFVQGRCGVSVDALERLADCLGLEIMVRPKTGRKGR